MWLARRIFRARRPVRKHVAAARLAFVLLAVAVGVVGTISWRIYRANARVWASDLHVWPAPRKGDRILIFAPHCDDETLALGGYTQKAVAAGAEVRVVFMTNGDGFTYSAERQYARLRLKPADYYGFGVQRQAEAIAAVSRSGLPPEAATFLGYPDGGLAELWLHYWRPGKPYRSRFTRCTRSPYANSLTPGALYCGQSVLADVKRAVLKYRPTLVFAPHANEGHADHWATYVFVTEALWELRNTRSGIARAGEPVEALYLVHRGDWPVPQGYHPNDDLPPPAALEQLDTEWRQIPLTPAQEEGKREAIGKYATQMRVMRRFLMAFVRRNELAGLRPPGTLSLVSDGALRMIDNWAWLPLSVHDPVDDSVQTDLGGSADLVSVAAAADSRRLYLRIATRKKLSPAIAYDVYWHPLPDDGAGTRGVSLRIGKPVPKGVNAVVEGNAWQVAVPRPPGRAVLVGVRCRYHRFTVDRTGWRVLEPPEASTLRAPATGNQALGRATMPMTAHRPVPRVALVPTQPKEHIR